jgi:hypothetical protein
MPRDSKGGFHLNTQRAMASDKHGSLGGIAKARGAGVMPPTVKGPAEPDGDEQSPVHEHLSALHSEMGGKHVHIHQDEMGNHTTHQVREDGQVEGPHDHDNIEALKEHLGNFFTEEEREPSELHKGY